MARKSSKINLLPWLLAIGGGIIAYKGFARPTVTVGEAGALDYDPGIFSRNFSEDEVSESSTAAAQGIPNNPTAEAWENAQILAQLILDPMAEFIGGLPTVTSWYRSPELNEAVGGAAGSDHLTGSAADLQYFAGGENSTWLLIRALLAMNLPWDQLIIYGGWDADRIHVSIDPGRLSNPRQEILQKTGSGYQEIALADAGAYYL